MMDGAQRDKQTDRYRTDTYAQVFVKSKHFWNLGDSLGDILSMFLCDLVSDMHAHRCRFWSNTNSVPDFSRLRIRIPRIFFLGLEKNNSIKK